MPPVAAFVDTNVLIYHLIQPDHELGPAATALLRRFRTGTEVGFLSSSVIFESIYILTRRYGAPREEVADSLLEILDFPGIRSDHPEALAEALRFWRNQGPLSFADCFHLTLAKQLGMTRIYSFDTKMNRYPGVERVQPA